LKPEPTQQTLTEQIEEGIKALELPEEPGLLYDPIRYTLSNGGKRIRPYLAVLAAGMCGGNHKEAIPAALAVELLHNFTLLHDDIMDGAKTRRGQPSVYAKWDVNTAILSGDVLFAEAFARLNYYSDYSKFSPEVYKALNRQFLEASRIVCEGQAYDLEFEKQDTVSIDQYLNMIEAKTAKMLSTAMVMGGIVSGADEERLELFDALGREAGIAFQIQDDLLDAVGKPGDFGKKIGGDIIEGKMTYLTIQALNKANKEESGFLTEVLQNQAGTISETDIEKVVDLYQNLNVLDEAREAIEKYYNKAERYLEGLDNSEYKEQLVNVLSTLANRKI